MATANQHGLAAARISARAAIVVAVISIVVAVITVVGSVAKTLIETSRPSVGTASPSTAGVPVLNAPQIYSAARNINFPLSECMEKARAALGSGPFTGIDSRDYISWGYRGENIGLVWCHTDARQVIFLAAGRDASTVENTGIILERSY